MNIRPIFYNPNNSSCFSMKTGGTSTKDMVTDLFKSIEQRVCLRSISNEFRKAITDKVDNSKKGKSRQDLISRACPQFS